MAATIADRHIEGLIGRCHSDLDQADLGAEVLRRLPGIVPVEAAFFAAVDPGTLLFTSAVAQEPLASATPLFLENEFGREDTNKFAALARGPDPVSSLDRATHGRRSASPRYREIMAGLGLGDELRAALITGRECWGVLCLHLADAEAGYSDHDLTVVRRIAPHLAEGLRQAVIRDTATTVAPNGPGIIILDHDLTVVSISAQAEQWLDEITAPHEMGLPLPVYAVASHLTATDDEPRDDAQDTTRAVHLRTRQGRWLAIHAIHMRGSAGDQIGVIVEPTAIGEVGSLLLSAHGLTPAQVRVVGLVLKGCSTREIVDRLHISANTVQEHLTAVFERFGVHSRRELIAAISTSAQS